MLSHIEDTTRLNVLLILTDQLRADAVGFANQTVNTPYLNSLANAGIVCTNAFVQSPQCQPSRASILTGRYPTAHRVWWNETPLNQNEVTIGNWLANSGYRTGYFGKLHVDGVGNHTDVVEHLGFKRSFLFEDWITTASDAVKRSGNRVLEEFYGAMGTKTWTGRVKDRQGHHEEVITDQAVDFFQTSRHPFFAVVSYHGPHPPYMAPDEFTERYRKCRIKIPATHIPNNMGHVLSAAEWLELKIQYYGAVSWIDDNIGRLLAAIPSNTIVVFTSDHGDILGDHGLFSKGMYAYDGNTRVPLVIRWPGIKVGTYTRLAQSIDILPTVMELVGLAVPRRVQGRSLAGALERDEEVNSYILSMIGYQPRLRMIRGRNWKYWISGQNEYLFNLANDPDEKTDLSSTEPEALSLFRLRLLQKLIEAEDPMPRAKS